MINPTKLESCFKSYIKNLKKWVPEDIIIVDLQLLQEHHLLHYHDPAYNDPTLTRYFHVIESEEKITLINDDFVVWIVPDKIDDAPITYTLIAINRDETPELELCFITAGVYNNSKLVLRLLEKKLLEIEENEQLLKMFIAK